MIEQANAIDHTGRYHVRLDGTDQWLVRPIDGWGHAAPEWTDHIDFSFGFNQAAAQEQKNFLGWAPHKVRAVIVKRRKGGQK